MSRAYYSPMRDLAELILGYGMVVGIIWTPEHLQKFLSPVALVVTLAVVLARGKSRDELGVGRVGLVRSLWILPTAIALAVVSVLVAGKIGTLHPLYKGDFAHVSGYVLWTIYQQFLLQDYFMDRLLRLVSSETVAVAIAGTLFAAAHLPNLVLTAATLVWGIVSCLLFRRYRNLWALGLAQGLLGLCFAVCVPDALHHHLRVGLGYLRYGTPPGSH
jgi:membrane protease YdiL (CAAX protease family)